VFDALLDIRVRRVDEPAERGGVCGRSWFQLYMALNVPVPCNKQAGSDSDAP
jgi:hypothetical protein